MEKKQHIDIRVVCGSIYLKISTRNITPEHENVAIYYCKKTGVVHVRRRISPVSVFRTSSPRQTAGLLDGDSVSLTIERLITGILNLKTAYYSLAFCSCLTTCLLFSSYFLFHLGRLPRRFSCSRCCSHRWLEKTANYIDWWLI